MALTVQLDATAIQRLFDLNGPEAVVELRQAAVAEITRRAFKNYLPDEVATLIEKQVEAVRSDLLGALRTEGLVQKLVTDRIEAAKRGIHLSAYMPAAVEAKARDLVDELLGNLTRKAVLEKLEAPEGVQQLIAAKIEQIVERIMKRLDDEGLEERIVTIINERIDSLVRARVETLLTGLQGAAP